MTTTAVKPAKTVVSHDVDQLLERYLTQALASNKNRHVGMELEFPLIHKRGQAVDMNVMEGLFRVLASIGFDNQRRSANGLPLRATDADGNFVTFDTCYGILEYVTAHTESMIPLYKRFREALAAMQPYLLSENHALLGMGIVPYPNVGQQKMLDVELTRIIYRFLAMNEGKKDVAHKRYFDFYTNISSEQVHFNLDPEQLPDLFSAFAHIDFANVLMFSNSPQTIFETPYLCARNKYYNMSSFRQMGVTGAQPETIRTMQDIINSYRTACMFKCHRNGKAKILTPVPFERYFSEPEFAAVPEDLLDFDLERNMVTTLYGTVEYRTLCAQPFDEAFAPSAFSTGLFVRLSDTLELARDFYRRYDLKDADALVMEASQSGAIAKVPDEAMEQFLRELLRLSHRGLCERGFGEEAFLKPLFAREKLTDSPARRFVNDPRPFDERVDDRKRIGQPIL